MNKLKFFLVTSSALFIFLGSVGFDVFTHLCNKDGLSISYFVQDDAHCIEDTCCDNHEEVDEEKHCDDGIVCEDDCEDEQHHFKIKLDYVNKIIIAPVLFNNGIPLNTFELQFALVELETGLNLNKPPPPKSCSQIIIEKQSWLI